MRYHEIIAGRFTLLPSHPILAEVAIDPADWFRFQELDADNPATRILGHDAPRNGRMMVHVACASDEVRVRLKDGWG
jgi:hypothetical protein